MQEVEALLKSARAIGVRNELDEPASLPRLNVRQVPAGFHYAVDILRDRKLALVVCVVCGKTWEEGDYPPQACVP